MNSISITWNGHSCFTVEKDGFSIVFDPYGPNTVPGLAPLSLTADMVLCSHEHGDHGYTDAVTLKHSGTKNPFSITKIDTWHDPEQGRSADRTGSTFWNRTDLKLLIWVISDVLLSENKRIC